MNNQKKCIVSVDISKDDFVAYWEGCSKVSSFKNRVTGAEKFVSKIKPLNPDLVVMEHTGGYEGTLCEVLWKHSLPVARVSPSRVRHFCKAKGYLAKTDPIDTRAIHEYGMAMELEPESPPCAKREALKKLVLRRQQVKKMLTAEKNHIQAPGVDKESRKSIERIIKYMKKEEKKLDEKIASALQQLPENDSVLKALDEKKGVGPVVLAGFAALLPEIGTLNRATVAALVGVAPFNNDSGKASHRRHIKGGRAAFRCILYMGTVTAIRVNPTIKAYYRRLTKAGKKPKVAMVAAMRKYLLYLNSVAREALLADPQSSYTGA